MSTFPVRSPAAKVGGIVYFGRMLDKIRAHAEGKLPPEYPPNLGRGFDGSCVRFLHIDYDALTKRTLEGGGDEEILQWAFENGRPPNEEEIDVWNTYMRKRGWNDDVTEMLAKRKREGGFAERADIETMFDFIDADEGRPLGSKAEKS